MGSGPYNVAADSADKAYVERRRETRFTVNQQAQLTILNASKERLPAHLVEASGKGMRFRTCRALAAGTAVKIELGDALLLAEVIFSRSEPEAGEGSYVTGVKIDQVLAPLSELISLHRSLLAEQTPRRAEVSAIEEMETNAVAAVRKRASPPRNADGG